MVLSESLRDLWPQESRVARLRCWSRRCFGPSTHRLLQKDVAFRNLGLAIIALNGTPSAQKDDLNYLLTFPLTNGSAHWYVAAAWDQEGMNNKPATMAIKTQAEFLRWLAERGEQLSSPVTIKFIP